MKGIIFKNIYFTKLSSSRSFLLIVPREFILKYFKLNFNFFYFISDKEVFPHFIGHLYFYFFFLLILELGVLQYFLVTSDSST